MTRVWVNLVLYAPLAVQTGRYLVEQIFYGEFLHWTGVWATRLLILVLAVTPLRLVFPKAGWTKFLLRYRRDLGVAAFLYALLHTLSYLWRKQDLSLILSDAGSMGMATAWAAILIMLVLAMTSNDRSVRKLGRRWKTLHRTVYALAVLTFAHWILTAFDPFWGWVHFATWGLLLVVRLVATQVRARR